MILRPLSGRFTRTVLAATLLTGLGACAERTETTSTNTDSAVANLPASTPSITYNPERDAFFGDLHVHTRFSFDAFLMGTRRTPDDAYRFAKGDPIEHASGFKMQLKKPLDFQAVSDHDIYLGMMPNLAESDSEFADHPIAEFVRNATDVTGSTAAFQAVLGHLFRMRSSGAEDELRNTPIALNAWQQIIASAERHNDPGNFTAFIAYEYTKSGNEFQNLHRNVVFRGSEVPNLPFAAYDTQPEELWDWLDAQRDDGIEGLAIPHNSNGSDGWMFAQTKWDGSEFDADYAEQRMRNEPIVENTQVKGTSDTHPLLSPNDEWADFEIMPLRVASNLKSSPQGSYVREAFLNGLVMQDQKGFNPYQFGVIGSSDTHNAAGSFDEDNYWSKTGVLDIEPQLRGSVPLDQPGPNGEKYANGASQYWGGSGLAGVWAESNTRSAIYDAFRRKETFSTSGPHIKLRFFGGYALGKATVDETTQIKTLYTMGVPMGGDLAPAAADAPHKIPSFYAWAMRDNDSGALQRLQVVKGWVVDGEAQEKVFDIACSDGLKVDPATHRCPDNGASVNISDCSVSANSGASELKTVWEDPEFNADQNAFYYARVLENPICRWSTWDAIRAGVVPRPDMHATIQERAWSSPIWFTPGR